MDIKSEKEIIQEIHDSYDDANINILNWAYNIINNQNEDVKKGERLAKLGFINTFKAITSKKEIQLKLEAEKKAKLIEYYNINYPFNKFITREEVSKINSKYNLVCVTADCYLMDIPEKNLIEIENFKIKDDNYLVYQAEIDDWKYSQTFNFLEKDELFNHYTNVKEEPFYISCPKNEADIKDGYIVKEDGFVLKDKEIKDPIVLKPVKGGFLIVTKWGLEAEDNLTINQNFN